MVVMVVLLFVNLWRKSHANIHSNGSISPNISFFINFHFRTVPLKWWYCVVMGVYEPKHMFGMEFHWHGNEHGLSLQSYMQIHNHPRKLWKLTKRALISCATKWDSAAILISQIKYEFLIVGVPKSYSLRPIFVVLYSISDVPKLLCFVFIKLAWLLIRERIRGQRRI